MFFFLLCLKGASKLKGKTGSGGMWAESGTWAQICEGSSGRDAKEWGEEYKFSGTRSRGGGEG